MKYFHLSQSNFFKNPQKFFLKQMSCVTTKIFFIAIIFSSQTSVLGAVEWPVYFEHLGFVHSVHNKWEVALNVNFYLPQLDLRLGKSMHRLRLLQGRNYDDFTDCYSNQLLSLQKGSARNPGDKNFSELSLWTERHFQSLSK